MLIRSPTDQFDALSFILFDTLPLHIHGAQLKVGIGGVLRRGQLEIVSRLVVVPFRADTLTVGARQRHLRTCALAH